MKKIALVVVVIAVAFMFAGVADAASCRSCAKPCTTCPKPGLKLFPSSPCRTCSPCNTCRPCNVCKPCKPCVPCQPMCVEYKRDVLGNKVPVWTYTKDGGARTDKATQYEATLISGQ